MKSYRINKKEAEQKLNLPAGEVGKQKRENAQDIISKSILNAVRRPARQFWRGSVRTINSF